MNNKNMPDFVVIIHKHSLQIYRSFNLNVEIRENNHFWGKNALTMKKNECIINISNRTNCMKRLHSTADDYRE